MVLTLALSLALLQQPSINIPAGYYTLKELGDSLTKQHVPVLVAAVCAQDTYAIRADNVNWDQFKDALQRDERLTLSPLHDGWMLEKSAISRRDEARERDRYVSYALKTIHSLFSTVASKCVELEPQPNKAKDDAVNEARAAAGTDPAKQDFAQLLYLFAAEHDMPFLTLSVPAYLTDPAGQGFDATVLTNLYDSRFLFMPDGDLRKMPFVGPKTVVTDYDLNRMAKAYQVGLKLVWDPISLATSMRWVMDLSSVAPTIRVTTKPDEIIPKRFHLSIPVASVLNEDALNAVRERAKGTPVALTGDAMKKNATAPNRSMRLSEALLRAANASQTNLVYYVSPLTDPLFPATTARNLSESVSDANQGVTDPKAGINEVVERTGLRLTPQRSTFAIPAKFTATSKDGILVVRNEMRFLDGLCETQATLSSGIQNGLLEGKSPELADVVKSVAGISPTQHFSSIDLDTCNPVTFHPFAKALNISTALMKKVSAIAQNATVTIPMSELDSGAKSAILYDLLQCVTQNNACADLQHDPLYLPVLLKNTDPDTLQVKVTRSSSGFVFELYHNKELLWNSWVHL